MAEHIDSEIAKLKTWRAEHRARGVGGRIEAAACDVQIAALRSLKRRLGLPLASYREDFQ